MANDTPFVELPSPPRSPSQTPAEADVRGNDFGPTADDDEHARAIAYRDHLVNMTRNKTANLLRLRGNREAYRTLQHKTMPLTASAPPYIEADAGPSGVAEISEAKRIRRSLLRRTKRAHW